MKAVSSLAINKEFSDLDHRFYWQAGYGLHSFGQLTLPDVIAYINNQKQHHAQPTKLIAYLERIDE